MNKKIGEKIRRLRAGKGYSQANIAEDLGITAGAYAKIERGETDASTSRLLQIAKILDVNVIEFFAEDRSINDTFNNYGFATKAELEALGQNILKEFEKLREELLPAKPKTKIAKKGVKKARKG